MQNKFRRLSVLEKLREPHKFNYFHSEALSEAVNLLMTKVFYRCEAR